MKKILKYSFIGLAALCTALLCGGYYMLGHALNPDELITRSRNSQASYEYMFGQYPELKPWVDSLQTAGALRNFYIKNDRGEGAEIQMGWLDRLDVLQWTATADELFGRNNETVTAGDSTRMRSSGTEMVVHGISMGAATTMMVSGEVEHGIHQQPFIKCFVEDCGYTSVWDEFRGELKVQYGLPAFPLLHVASRLCKQEYGWDFREASALEQVRKCTLPMLFIHGDADSYVPTWMVYPLYEAKPEPKELWIVPGSAHAMSYKDYPQEYTEHVKKFVGKYIR